MQLLVLSFLASGVSIEHQIVELGTSGEKNTHRLKTLKQDLLFVRTVLRKEGRPGAKYLHIPVP